MKKSHLTCLALRILGVYFVSLGAIDVPGVFLKYGLTSALKINPEQASQSFHYSIGYIIGYVAVGITLLIFSDEWSKKLTPPNHSDELSFSFSSKDIYALVLVLFGINLILSAAPQMVNGIFRIRHWTELNSSQHLFGSVDMQSILLGFSFDWANIVLGGIFVFKAHPIAAWWSKLGGKNA